MTAECQPQRGILQPIPALARYLTFSCAAATRPEDALRALADHVDGERAVAGIGESLARVLGARIPGLRSFPRHSGAGFDVPSTPGALWVWLRGDDRGELLHHSRAIENVLAPAFDLDAVIDAFRYRDSRDLTGYEDGTENPKDADAVAAAIVGADGDAPAGSSFVAVQQWVHDLDAFGEKSPEEQDHTFGRSRVTNEELDDAPESAHVKRTAQESFDPEAFVVRRSMPWADDMHAGLVFVAFGASFDAFEAQLTRMVGAEDGIADALFGFTRPVTGAYYWCPPLRDGRLDLRALGI